MSAPEPTPASTTPPADTPITTVNGIDNIEEKAATTPANDNLDTMEDVALDAKTEEEVLSVEPHLNSEGETLATKPKTSLLHVDINNDKDSDQSSMITPTPLKVEETQPGTTPIGLDSLLSPKDPDARFSLRESMGSEATDEDSRFSTVLLSARQSMETLDVSDTATLTAPDEHGDDRRNTLSGNDIVTMVHRNRVHKKTASTSTIVSANNVPFSPSREGESDSQRNSLDGQQQKLHEEFTRIQLEPTPTEGPSDVDWNFWGDVVSDYLKFAAERPEELAKAIEKGIPKSLRGMIWQLMSASKEPELEETYLRLLKETSPHEKAINRDLGRTFPHHTFFTDGHGIGQENLFNVLKAYSIYDPQVGYCQGLPFVVAILLLNMPDEEAFCLLVRLMYSYDLRGHFLPEMPKLQLRMFQFDRLLEELLPVLHVHFIRQGVKSSMYCSQWFLTMFSYRFPLDIVFRIYDNCLASGIEAMFAFSMMLLVKNEETLLSLKFDQLPNFLNTKVFDVYQIQGDDEDSKEQKYDVDRFVHDAVSLRITPFMLDTYANEYEELVRTRDAHTKEVDDLRNSNRALHNQVNNLENSLAQLNTEHCEVLNELVRQRLRNEEIEGELVRYKLLYAEAMHQNEDAMSSHRLSTNLTRSRSSFGMN
ncbi:hypothetical protein QCA50_009601 [Cerrena zonata]|uniref:Rab-GAP TBC domain-containing protein n=1 Tax=Cerrena zonata TaxID=2478898 RepID=A0AAW0GDF8_9APHY